MVDSTFSLFQVMTLETWPENARATMILFPDYGVLYVLFFICYVYFTNITLLNLVTGVLVENILDIASRAAKEEAERQKDLRKKVIWAANKRLETSKFKFKFSRARNLEMIGLVLGCCIEAKFCK